MEKELTAAARTEGVQQAASSTAECRKPGSS